MIKPSSDRNCYVV